MARGSGYSGVIDWRASPTLKGSARRSASKEAKSMRYVSRDEMLLTVAQRCSSSCWSSSKLSIHSARQCCSPRPCFGTLNARIVIEHRTRALNTTPIFGLRYRCFDQVPCASLSFKFGKPQACFNCGKIRVHPYGKSGCCYASMQQPLP